MTFKVGDEVICINDNFVSTYHGNRRTNNLCKGKVYTVTMVYSQEVQIESVYWFSYRFILSTKLSKLFYG